MPFKDKLRRGLPYLIVATGAFLLAYVAIFLFAFPSDVLPDEGTLPNVIGLPYEAAAATLEKDGFVALEGERRMHQTAPEGTVLEQDPPAESRQKRGTEVRLVLSAGPQQKTPSLGLPVDTVTNKGPVIPENPEPMYPAYPPPPPPPEPADTFIRITPSPAPKPNNPWGRPPRPTPVPTIPVPSPQPSPAPSPQPPAQTPPPPPTTTPTDTQTSQSQ